MTRHLLVGGVVPPSTALWPYFGAVLPLVASLPYTKNWFNASPTLLAFTAIFLLPGLLVLGVLSGNCFALAIAVILRAESVALFDRRAWGRVGLGGLAKLIDAPNTRPLLRIHSVTSQAGLVVFASAWTAFVGCAAVNGLIEYFGNQRILAPTDIRSLSSFGQTFLSLAILDPLIETVVVVVLCALLRKALASNTQVVFSGVALWSLLHGLLGVWWQVPSMAWLFLILIGTYCGLSGVWSVQKRFLTLYAVHALNNSLALGLILLRQIMRLQ